MCAYHKPEHKHFLLILLYPISKNPKSQTPGIKPDIPAPYSNPHPQTLIRPEIQSLNPDPRFEILDPKPH